MAIDAMEHAKTTYLMIIILHVMPLVPYSTVYIRSYHSTPLDHHA